jgi:hypothetical protein
MIIRDWKFTLFGVIKAKSREVVSEAEISFFEKNGNSASETASLSKDSNNKCRIYRPKVKKYHNLYKK